MHAKALTLTMLLSAIVAAVPAHAATVADPANDFLPSYTAGPALPDLDVTSFSVDYSSVSKIFTLAATFAGAIDPSTAGLYVFGVNTGTGVAKPFAGIGAPDVIFNQAITIRKDGTGSIGATTLDPNTISIVGNTVTAAVPLSLLPTTGFAPTQYGFNLWPRIGTGNNNQITDFSPNNATLSAVPEPATWGLMLAGFAMVGAAARTRHRSAKTVTQ